MKKLLLSAVALFATSAFAGGLVLDVDAHYVRSQDGGNGMLVGPGVYMNLLHNETGFMKDLSVGGTIEYSYMKGGFHGAFAGALLRADFAVPSVDVYAELGAGYTCAINNFSGSSNAAVTVAVGGMYPLNDDMKIGLAFDFDYTVAKAPRGWSLNVGPTFAMAL